MSPRDTGRPGSTGEVGGWEWAGLKAGRSPVGRRKSIQRQELTGWRLGRGRGALPTSPDRLSELLAPLQTGEEHTVTHLQYVAWPDHGVPMTPQTFWNL